ncbi:DUF2726 domain-containing protein [Pontibacter kalidii]|uniref:DUF2726 domain-containing protein n=1 Tax=Pontibacter kalidii TaxID=2592049 RepID=UPI00224FA1D4|nr:DUF2726 domain-containing protein [Pontibacter kalidii]
MKPPPFDPDIIYQLVSNKDWEKLITIFKDQKKCSLIFDDPRLSSFINQYLIIELLSNTLQNQNPSFKYYLQDFYTLYHSTKHNFTLNLEDYKRLVVKIAELEATYDIEKALNFAQLFPEEEICCQIIQHYEESKPNIIGHSQQEEVQVTYNKFIIENDGRISLFKSRQEYLFYRAVRDIFQSFMVFPNVALSAVIDFESVKDHLTQEEKDYFFKALIDCVIIDSEDNFRAIRFIELDSPYHRDSRQKMKDGWKDRILGVAGQRLIRIESIVKHENEEATIATFKKLIREVINE